jgi:flagellar basal-body rod protein FlgB
MGIFNDVSSLQKGLSASWTRNSVISNNIANVDTPGFKSSSVEFEDLYQQSLEDQADGFKLKKTQSDHMDIGNPDTENVEPVIVQNSDTTNRMDGNNVDIDQQMANLAKNIIYYNALTRKVSGEFTQLGYAIREGK